MPTLNVTVADSNMAAAAAVASSLGAVLLMGPASTGTANTIYNVNSVDDAKSQLGNGPLPDAAAFMVRYAGGPIYCIPTDQSGVSAATASRLSAVTATGSVGVVTVNGTPTNKYQAYILITVTGSETTAKGRISWDGGVTFGAEKLLSAMTTPTDNGGRTTGITIAYAVGTYTAGGYYTFHSHPVYMTTTALSNAVAAALAASACCAAAWS